MMKLLENALQISSSGVFHVRLLTPTSTVEAGSDWLPGCSPRLTCNSTVLVCLSHAQTSSIPSSSSSSSLSVSSSSFVQPLCVTPTPGGFDLQSELVARFPIEFTWPVRILPVHISPFQSTHHSNYTYVLYLLLYV